ncbi:MAG: AAA family ATPase [Candidatus Thorarchaeota archaeon]
MEIAEVSKRSNIICDKISEFIIGKKQVIEKVMIALLADGHILFEDFPGLAKTLMARLFSEAISANFKRVQFTPDLLPSDITGSYIYNQKLQEFEFRKGPIHTNILLADELNRSPPKTQAALLEAMQEYQVTIEGKTFHLEPPFWVIATQNPIELEGTFGLPEAQVDRFLVRLRIGYPDQNEENNILMNRIKRQSKNMSIDQPIISIDEFIRMQKAIEGVKVVPDILNYITSIVQATRTHPKLEIGASPRGSLALLSLARASAAFHGRDYVTPEDVKEFAIPALAHRVILKSGEWLGGIAAESVILDVLSNVVAPRKDISLELEK